ncbi:hypothetical protein Glove_368g6 [Diversispora epigaea]|uniref:Protein kinase domain-containing protein n=1 Tax=Diversispora epigaea TaxID=1348612 RepID=A0A397H7Y2_9GLOM|nr:hypothetical protein Glove_368g6 [Diversispora epigaea]
MFEPDDYRICHNCGKITYIDIRRLCEQCYTSGNKNIDNFIKHTQISGLKLSLKEYYKIKPELQPYLYLEWVPFNNFLDIEYIAEGGFSKIYKATWEKNSNGQKKNCVLKVLNNSKNVDTKFLNELKLTYQLKSKFLIKCYGATQDPKTKKYAFILDYAPNGDLHHFLRKNFKKVMWKKKIDLFRDIIIGIKLLHDKKIVHCDLHSGNILIITNDFKAVISDLGFSQRVTSNSENSKKAQMYGVISYMAPELFKGQPYSFASDIYSLGMIMWQLTSGHRPFHDRGHGPILILDILDGKRPKTTKDTPECWENLMKKCWHPNPSQRPTIDEIYQLFLDFEYYCDYSKDDTKKKYPDKCDIWLEFKKAEKARLEMIKSKKPNPLYIYSLGMIMWQLTSGHRPFHDRGHGPILILDILDGKRPKTTKDTPECWENLMKKCWHPNPSQRPTIDEIYQLFLDFEYYCDYSKDDTKKKYPDKCDIWLEFKKAEKARLEMIKSKKPNPLCEHPNSKYFSISLDSMLESIIDSDKFDITNSNSDRINNIHNIENSELSDQFSNDNFDIMNSK